MSDFLCNIDEFGNIYVNPGSVIDSTQSPTAFFTVGGNVEQGATGIGGYRLPTIYNSVPIGGAGDSLISTSTITATLSPVGCFVRLSQLEWRDQYGNTLSWDGSTGAEIADATDVIADITAAGAPEGTYTLTTYGEDTFNGGSPGTLSLAYDGTAPTTVCSVGKDYGTAQAGQYTRTAWGIWESDDDPNFTINLQADTTSEISDATDVLAIRAAGSSSNPSGTYVATSYGETTYGDGSTFNLFVSYNLAMPIAGYGYIELVLSSGSVASVRGPFFASSLPANSSTLEVIPVCYSNGTTLIQIQKGTVNFR
jgi:hypothetical protein